MPRFLPLPTKIARAYLAGGLDANGQVPERAMCTSDGMPCRHCLQDIPEGREMLILAHRPFEGLQPYAEVGPIFLCADACEGYAAEAGPPPILTSISYLLRGYGPDDRIVYGTGRVTPTKEISDTARQMLDDPRVAYVHLRSASNNCYQLRIEAD